jgi:hypothetical protein
VTGRVADAEKDRLVLGPSLLQRLLAPGVPVHRIVGVLEQVWAGFVYKMARQLCSPSSADTDTTIFKAHIPDMVSHPHNKVDSFLLNLH